MLSHHGISDWAGKTNWVPWNHVRWENSVLNLLILTLSPTFRSGAGLLRQKYRDSPIDLNRTRQWAQRCHPCSPLRKVHQCIRQKCFEEKLQCLLPGHVAHWISTLPVNSRSANRLFIWMMSYIFKNIKRPLKRKFIIERVTINIVCSLRCPVKCYRCLLYNGALWATGECSVNKSNNTNAIK